MTVEYSTSPVPGDANYKNRHAKVGEIEFTAMPFQPYLAKHNGKGAIVSDLAHDKWSVTIYTSDQTGRCTPIAHRLFWKRDQGAAFEWAAEELTKV